MTLYSLILFAHIISVLALFACLSLEALSLFHLRRAFTLAEIQLDDYSRWLAVWSPDGMQLAYERRKLRTNERQLMVWSSQSHDEEPLTAVSNTDRTVSDWSRDGKWLVVYQATPEANEIWLLPVASAPHAERKAQKIVSDSTHQLFQAHSSPNGRWIVFEAVANSSNPESTLYTVPMSGGRWTRITDGKHWDDKPRWSPDGRTIYFLSGPGGFFNVWGDPLRSGRGKASWAAVSGVEI